MKMFEVRWQFVGGFEMPRMSLVRARDHKHAEEKIWLNHIEVSQLRNKIEFISVKEVK
jgi:hypothetical protein